MSIRNALRRRLLFASFAAGASLAPCTAVHADYRDEFIPFPQVILHYSDQDVATLEQHGAQAAVDFFYTAEYRRGLLLAEFFIADEERELERLAIGWAAPGDVRLWLGRFHTALDPWNRQHHHGAYVQTTIFRPGVIEFEDDGGVIPAHATGITLDHGVDRGGRMLRYTVDLGLGPQLLPGGLRALDVLEPGTGEHDIALVAAVARHDMDGLIEDSGAFAGYVRVPSAVSGIEALTQHILGGYVSYVRAAWHLRASALWVGTRLERSGGSTDDPFIYGYLQPEYWLSKRWTLYGRVEGTHSGDDNLYLQEVPAFIRQRGLVGARYQLSGTQAVKAELAALEQYATRYGQFLLQWSAAFP